MSYITNKTTKINCCCGSSYLYRNGKGYTNHIASQKHKRFHIKYIADFNKSEYGIPELYSSLETYDKDNKLIWDITFDGFRDIIKMLNPIESEDDYSEDDYDEADSVIIKGNHICLL